MQFANVLLALGGDGNNTVPKYGVSVAEIAVLLAIHGPDSVHEIEPLDAERPVNPRAEVERLLALYPAKNEDNRAIVIDVFPGASAASMPRHLDALGLDPSLFKATERAAPKRSTEEPEAAAPKRGRKAKAAEPVPAPAPVDPSNADALFDDGEGDDITADAASDILA